MARDTGTTKKRGKKPAKKKPPPKPKTARAAVEAATPDIDFHKLPAWPKPDQFLHAFRVLGNVSAACKAAAVGRTTVYRRRTADEDFALAWADVEEETTDIMEREAYRRAVVGTSKPVFYKGEAIGTIQEYSDVLLIFMLKARKPETYRERVDHRFEGGGASPASRGIDVSKLSLKEARALKTLLAKAQPDKPVPTDV